jgi:hypothetical protein
MFILSKLRNSPLRINEIRGLFVDIRGALLYIQHSTRRHFLMNRGGCHGS